MRPDFEELDYKRTRLGELVLRRRLEPRLGVEVFEVKLGDDFLMSSLFTAAEVALADLALPPLGAGPLDVVVGGLGLGYTAAAALAHPAVGSLLVIDALGEVIDWHRRGLLPVSQRLTSDSRCELREGDFFALARSGSLDARDPARRFHAVLVDIDHSPRHILDPSHGSLYAPAGLAAVRAQLHPGGCFALWSNDPPEDDFLRALSAVFDHARAEVVEFDNPLQRRKASNTVYLAYLSR